MVKLKYEQFTINSPDRRDLWIFLAWDLVGVGVKSCNEFFCLTLLISGWGEGGNCQNVICLFGSSYSFISTHRAYCSFNVVHLFSKWHCSDRQVVLETCQKESLTSYILMLFCFQSLVTRSRWQQKQRRLFLWLTSWSRHQYRLSRLAPWLQIFFTSRSYG